MRNRYISWLVGVFLSCTMQMTFAAGFIATVEENKINFGHSIQLKLQLEDAKATDAIDLSPLAKDFMIYNQQQFSTYSNTNGVVRAESGWHVILMPKQVGEYIIPAIALKTDKGVLKTDPIKIYVQQAQAGDNGANDTVGISLVSTVNKAKVFVNEPVIFTLKIISYKPIANIVLDDIKSNDAIIEKIGEPKQYDQSHGGVRAHIIEIRYAVTALKPGSISIAPATMHGELQVPAQGQKPPRFGLFNNIFMDNFVELKPFSLQSEAITLDVLPAASKIKDWLPLTSLVLTQSWDNSQDLKIGDTVTRKIKMVAKGGFAKQLPSVKDFMQHDKVKIYANKPAFNDSFDPTSDTIIGTREEEYSIVPQEDGTITFPEIQIKWWNLNTKKLEISTLPAKTLQVLPNTANTGTGVTLDYSVQDQPQQIEAPAIVSNSTAKSTILYAIIGALLGIVITLGLVLLFVMFRKRPVKRKAKIKSKKHEPEIVVNSVDDLRKFVLQYAVKNWQIPADVTLNRLGDALANNNYIYDIEMYSTMSQYINAGIYAKVAVDMPILLAQWEEFKNSVVKNKQAVTQEKPTEDYSTLNPT